MIDNKPGMKVPTKSETTHAESGYRRGYTHGYAEAMKDMAVIMGKLGYSRPREARNILAAFHDAVLLPWRAAASRGWCEPPRAAPHLPMPWNALRQAVLKRDGLRCVACGAGDDLQCDHVREVRRGGVPTMDNLRTLCGECHRRRDSTS